MKTAVTFRKISDRQDLIGLMETREQGLEPYMFDRIDMFWAEVEVTGMNLKATLTYSIDTRVPRSQGWSLHIQYGERILDTAEIRGKILVKWQDSQEKLQADTWITNLEEAGYFDRGRADSPNSNAATCRHCGACFKKGTTHPHTILPKEFSGKERIIHHHKQMEKIIKERGLVKLGVSGLPDIPSLEELGELEPCIVGEPCTG